MVSHLRTRKKYQDVLVRNIGRMNWFAYFVWIEYFEFETPKMV